MIVVIAQVLGILAVATFLLSFQLKTRRNIIVVNLISRFLYIVQYILLGAFEGAVLDFMGFLLSFVAKYKETKFITKYCRIIMIAVNVLLLLVGLSLYENIFSLFAIFGIIFEVTALWLTKEKNIRILSLIAAPCWLVYNLTNSAYGSAVGNILAIFSITIAMIRLDFKKENKD